MSGACRHLNKFLKITRSILSRGINFAEIQGGKLALEAGHPSALCWTIN